MNNIDIGRAVKAPFADKEWVTKTLFGFLWTILVVTIPAVFGYQIQYIKSVAYGREDLPEWDNFGDKWVKGFLAALAGFIYFLPVVLLGMFAIIPAAIAGWNADEPSLAIIGALGLWGFLAFIYGLAVTVFFYAALTHYAMKDSFGAFFEFGEIFGRLKTGGYFMAWLFAWVVSLVTSVITSVLGRTFVLAILSPAVSFLSFMMIAHLLGQYARAAYGAAAAVPAPYAPPAPPAPYQGYAPPAQTPPPPAPAPYVPPAPSAPTQAPPPAAPAPQQPAPYVAPAAPPAPPVAAPAESPAPVAPPAPVEPSVPTAPPAAPPTEVAPPPPPPPPPADAPGE